MYSFWYLLNFVILIFILTFLSQSVQEIFVELNQSKTLSKDNQLLTNSNLYKLCRENLEAF